MKKRLFEFATKGLLTIGITCGICCCGDDASSSSTNDTTSSQSSTTGTPAGIVVSAPCRYYSDSTGIYLIGADGLVKDTLGNLVAYADLATGLILSVDNATIIAQNISIDSLPLIQPTLVLEPAYVLAADQNYVIYPSSWIVTDAAGNQVGYMAFSADTPTIGTIMNLENIPMFKDVDLSILKVVVPAADIHEDILPGTSSSFTELEEPSSCASDSLSYAVDSSSSETSSSSQEQSSSSARESSSSSEEPLSSSSPYYNMVPYEPIKYINGGRTGSGWATRYWDCCKPHCAWSGKGGIQAHACNARGDRINDSEASSMCNGGNAGTCTSQSPMVVNDTLAYAYAAVPSADGGSCGKCYALKFTGKGKYESLTPQKALAGKTLIIMTSNIGDDVQQGQFDIMIPGGGVGKFNGCSSMGWGNLGATEGGLLSDCETEVGRAGDVRKKRKECLVKKCESTFKSDVTAMEGCLFLATWYEAAGNPTHEYKEVECPTALRNNF